MVIDSGQRNRESKGHIPGGRILRLLTLLLAGCGSVHFTDPRPPQLFRSTAEYTASAAAEPVVWMPVLDLFAEKTESCDTARAWTRGAIRAAFLAVQAPRLELQGADLSPTCAQAPDRTLDAAALQQQVAAAVAAFPGAHVRVVVVYANDIALPVPPAVHDALATLRAAGFLWVVGRDPVAPQLAPDQAVGWTFTYDPALPGALAALVAQQLPLQSDAAVDSGFRVLLGSGDLPRAREIKVCAASDGVSLVRAEPGGSATAVDTAQPPLFRVIFPQRVAVPKPQFSVQHAAVELEGCSAECDRYFTGFPGDLRRWDSTRGCLLEAR